MRHKDLFGFVVRLVGLAIGGYGFYLAIENAVGGAETLVQIWRQGQVLADWVQPVVFNLLRGIGFLAGGIWILRRSEWIGRLAHRPLAGGSACAKCGYDLRASPERCPECGTVRAGT